MTHPNHLDWPFFDERHRTLATELEAWAATNVPHEHGADVDADEHGAGGLDTACRGGGGSGAQVRRPFAAGIKPVRYSRWGGN